MTELKLFEEQSCPNCGVRFGVPVEFTANRRKDTRTFYCPNGHPMSYRESEADMLRRERDRLKQNEAWYEARLRESQASIDLAERRIAAAKGQVTKLKNRASKGVCPCCNRHFTNLERHMHSQHPGFASEPDAASHVN